MVSGVMTVICILFFLGLIFHWLMVYKMSHWMHLPGPCTPLVFVFKSLCNFNNVIVWRETYKKYQKVSLKKIDNKSLLLIIYQDGLCFIPLMNIPLLFVGDFRKLKLLFSHPGEVCRYILKWVSHFAQMSRVVLLFPMAKSSSSCLTTGHRRCRVNP